MEPGLVIDRLGEPDASVLTSAGYRKNSDGEVEGIRLNDIVECCFQVQGEYGGQNAIHRLAAQELALLSGAASLPQEAFRKRVDVPDPVTAEEISVAVAAPTTPGADQN
jgi:hypothetical protein